MRRYHRGSVPVLFYKTPTMTRRADRLFQIAELLRGRRLTTAQQLADWLNISLRTVYRDVRDLQLSGVPIEGEAGIGYRLSRAASLPPLTFTADELAALAAGAKDNGPPGLRPHYHANYYGAFVLDPDGNNIEAVCHAPA